MLGICSQDLWCISSKVIKSEQWNKKEKNCLKGSTIRSTRTVKGNHTHNQEFNIFFPFGTQCHAIFRSWSCEEK